jgi:methyltransferase (TIGR00027 family)
MANNGVENQPSETAFFAALRRALAHQEYQNDRFGPDYLADIFLPPHFRFFLKFNKVRENTKTRLNEALPGLTEYMIARTAYFDQLFLNAVKDEIPQIVLLGAGYDTRAYRFSQLNRRTKIYELDIKPTQERKKECLKKARINIPPQVSFIPINFREDSIPQVLEKAGFDQREKALFIWEGVSYYLDPESVDETLRVVSHFSSSGSAIAFDYTFRISEDRVDDYYGVREFYQTMKEHHGDEELLFSIGEGEIEPFLEQRDLKLVNHLDNKQIEKRFLVDENDELAGQIPGHFCFVLAARI